MPIVRKAAIPSITGQTTELQSILSPMKESIETITGARSGVDPIKTLQTPKTVTGTALVGQNDIVNKINEIVTRLNVTGTADNELTIIGQTNDPYPTTAEVDARTGTAGSPRRNFVVNGSQAMDQRNLGGAAFSTTSTIYTLDQWRCVSAGGAVVSTQRLTATPPAGFAFYRRHIITTADASLAAGDYAFLDQLIETVNLASWKFGTASAQPLTLSFWVRSSVTGTFGAALTNFTNNRNFGFTYVISAANTWEYKTVAITGDTTGTWPLNTTSYVRLIWDFGLGSTFQGVAGWQSTANVLTVAGCTKLSATLNATLDFTGVQLELGTAATEFEYLPTTEDHARCLRYYENFGGVSTTWSGEVVNGINYYACVYYKVAKRAAPTITLSYVGNSGFAATVPNVDTNGLEMFRYTKLSNATVNGGYMVFNTIASAEF